MLSNNIIANTTETPHTGQCLSSQEDWSVSESSVGILNLRLWARWTSTPTCDWNSSKEKVATSDRRRLRRRKFVDVQVWDEEGTATSFIESNESLCSNKFLWNRRCSAQVKLHTSVQSQFSPTENLKPKAIGLVCVNKSPHGPSRPPPSILTQAGAQPLSYVCAHCVPVCV